MNGSGRKNGTCPHVAIKTIGLFRHKGGKEKGKKSPKNSDNTNDE